MINPQMGMMPGQLPEVPTQAELWKDEKQKYRPFIIMFGVGIITVFALLLISFIYNVSATGLHEIIRDKFFDMWGDSKYDISDAADDADIWYKKYVLAFPIISYLILGAGVMLYIVTVYNSYKAKSFAKLSGFTTTIVFMGAAFSVFQLMQMAWADDAKIILDFPGGIFQVVAYSLVIALAILGSQISKIRRLFFISARVEALKNDPAYQAAQAQFQAMMKGQMPNGPMGPFGPVAPMPPQEGVVPNSVGASPMQQVPQISKEQEKLENMSIENLRKVAKKLSISGSEKMDKKELISAIMRVTDGK